MYTFRALHDQAAALPQRTSRLTLSPSTKEQQALHRGAYGAYMAHFRGALLRLFGEPQTTEGDAEYVYIIEARAADNARWVLKVIEGASGPSLRGNKADPSLLVVAEALRHLIETTEPADFEAPVRRIDTNTPAIYGCRDGVCYWHES